MAFKITDNSLRGFKGSVTRALSSAQGAVGVASPVLLTVKSNVETLQTRWSKYLDVWDQYISERSSLPDDEFTELEKKHATFEIHYQTETNKILDVLGGLQDAVPITASPTQQSVKVRLPEIKINSFDGKLEEWQTWWDSFRSLVHDRKDMDKVLKMTHLKSCLKGKALLVVSGFQVTDQDYDAAIAALQDRFANPDRVKQTLVLQLINMVKPKNTAKELEQFKLDFERIMKTLEHYVTDLQSSHWFIAIILQSMLPAEAEMFIFQKFKTKYFAVDQISTGLADHLEFLDRIPNNGKSQSDTDKFPQISSKSLHREKAKFSNQTQSMSTDKTQIGTYSLEATSKNQCLLCSSDSHRSRHCSKYTDATSRRSRLLDMGRCPRCLRNKHNGRCLQSIKCFICNKTNHNEVFCYINFGGKVQSDVKLDSTVKSNKQVNSTSVEINSVVSSTKSTGSKYSSALATAQVKVSNIGNSKSEFVRCFFDPGSQISFITSKLAKKLQLKTVESRELVLQGFQSSPKEGQFDTVTPLVSLGKRIKKIRVVVLNELPGRISTPGIHKVYQMLQDKGIKTADEISTDSISEIELMIGSDYFADFIGGVTRFEGVDLFETPGGCIPFGKIPPNFSSNTNTSIKTNVVVCRLTANISPLHVSDLIEEDTEQVHKLWELESIGINPSAPSIEDDCAYRKYVDSVKYHSGQYFVRLPWKENCPLLPTNYRLALGQVHSLRRNLSKVPGRLDAYHNIIQDQLKQGFVEKVPDALVSNKTHYIPHHGVLKDSETTPLRIVYNCSAHDGRDSPSLNDCLIKGPSLSEKIGDVLLKFRVNNFAFCADISKAFLRVGLQNVDRDFVRFLWFRDPQNPEAGLETYRFASVLFGSTSSPFLLMATLDYHLNKLDSPFKNLIAKSFYMDNLQGTLSSEEELLEFYFEANKQLSSANMPLRTWVTNNEKLRFRIEEDNSGYVVPTTTSVLGLNWDVKSDMLSLKSSNIFVPEIITKRNLLSLVSTVFDPLGLLCPVVIRGKILIQAAWRTNVSWNDPLGEEFLSSWAELCREFKALSQISVPRKVATQGVCYVMHIFCDSSTKAYGCAAYLVGNTESNLVMAKAKVAPLKTKTLPQLELTSIWLGTKLASYIHKVLRDIDISRTVIWSDNEAAIQWVRNDNSKIIYVKNRVAEIRETSVEFQIFHVSSGENPADLVTRGVKVEDLVSNPLWLKGPNWLTCESLWPSQKDEVVVYEITAERQIDPVKIECLFEVKKFSSLEKIFTITKYVFQFLRKLLLKKSPNRVTKILLPAPAVYWLRHYQLAKFKETFTWLFYSENPDSIQFKSLYNILQKPHGLSAECSDLIKDLGLYFDPSIGLIRSRGRLQHAEIAVNSKYPILVPPGEHLTNLFIHKAHRYNLHGGVQETLATVRRQLWIPKGRQSVRKVIRKCVTCRKVEGRPCVYPGPPSLPLHRVVLNRPFEYVGVDYSGPIIITKTEDNEPRKVYICLFTCTATRAVHLDVALDMTAESFLLIFRRFCGTWSVPKQIISDNGSNFKATAKFLEQISSDAQVQEYSSSCGIVWKFIAPRAPWQGGFYERMIKVVKNCLQKVLYRKRVSLDELQTVVVEIQSRVNNRPLTYIHSDRMSPEPLSPSHLLYGRSIEAMPPVVLEDDSDPTYMDHNQLNKQFSLLSCIISKFEKVWKHEYIVSLRERHYGCNRAKELNNLRVGDVVLVQVKSPRSEWPLGRVVELRPDSEGVIRSVDVYCKGHVSTQTVEKLVPLEVSESVDEELVSALEDNVNIDVPSSEMPHPLEPIIETRPQRASKTRATLERRELIKQGAL